MCSFFIGPVYCFQIISTCPVKLNVVLWCWMLMANLFEAMNYDIQPYHKQSGVNRKVYKPSTPHNNNKMKKYNHNRCPKTFQMQIVCANHLTSTITNSPTISHFKLCINHKMREICFCLDNKNRKWILDDLMMFNQPVDLFSNAIAAFILFVGFSFVLSLRHPCCYCLQPHQLNVFSRVSFSLGFFYFAVWGIGLCSTDFQFKQINTLAA